MAQQARCPHCSRRVQTASGPPNATSPTAGPPSTISTAGRAPLSPSRGTLRGFATAPSPGSCPGPKSLHDLGDPPARWLAWSRWRQDLAESELLHHLGGVGVQVHTERRAQYYLGSECARLKGSTPLQARPGCAALSRNSERPTPRRDRRTAPRRHNPRHQRHQPAARGTNH